MFHKNYTHRVHAHNPRVFLHFQWVLVFLPMNRETGQRFSSPRLSRSPWPGDVWRRCLAGGGRLWRMHLTWLYEQASMPRRAGTRGRCASQQKPIYSGVLYIGGYFINKNVRAVKTVVVSDCLGWASCDSPPPFAAERSRFAYMVQSARVCEVNPCPHPNAYSTGDHGMHQRRAGERATFC